MRQKRYTLKREPADFVVEEILDIPLDESGDFALYKLTKENLDTPTALNLAKVALGVESGLGHCGMKDRYSRSIQYFSVPHDQKLSSEISDRSFSAVRIGRIAEALTMGSHSGNRFAITVRDLSPEMAKRMEKAVVNAKDLPIPNYFDSQRFTYQISPPEDAITLIFNKEYESALKQMIATPFRKERRNVKDAKRIIRDNWGDWKGIADKIESTDAPNGFKRVVSYLTKSPADFLGGLREYGKQPLKMAMNAHQSYHWNWWLKEATGRIYGHDQLLSIRYQAGELLLPDASRPKVTVGSDTLELLTSALTEDLSEYSGPDIFGDNDEPVGSSNHQRSKTGDGNFIGDEPPLTLVIKPLEEFGLKANTHPRPLFFRTDDLVLKDKGQDSGKKGNWVKIGFTLPPGAYATVVVKTLTGC